MKKGHENVFPFDIQLPLFIFGKWIYVPVYFSEIKEVCRSDNEHESIIKTFDKNLPEIRCRLALCEIRSFFVNHLKNKSECKEKMSDGELLELLKKQYKQKIK